MSDETKPCPCCDVDLNALSPMAALAYGVALGDAFHGRHGINHLLCDKCRVPYFKASLEAVRVFGASAVAKAEGLGVS